MVSIGIDINLDFLNIIIESYKLGLIFCDIDSSKILVEYNFMKISVEHKFIRCCMCKSILTDPLKLKAKIIDNDYIYKNYIKNTTINIDNKYTFKLLDIKIYPIDWCHWAPVEEDLLKINTFLKSKNKVYDVD